MDINTLLITPEYIKKYSTVGDNTHEEYIIPAIIDAQLMGLQPIIGTYLYDKLCELTTEEALTAPYQYLLDNYVAPYLLNKTQAYLVMNLYAKQRNAGVVQYLDTNQSQIDIANVKFIKSEFENKATFYSQRMVQYLCANNTDYPEYHSQRDMSDLPSDCKDTYSNQMNFKKYTRKGKI